ncbi:hypothetical protein HMPREF0294_0695 [Corynebacterium glucuronolyticum ATCC 51867]|nr:hypothetical protein HMPREF0294_0695 [Corynebacterium glucuronolyticum ATCC 51867]
MAVMGGCLWEVLLRIADPQGQDVAHVAVVDEGCESPDVDCFGVDLRQEFFRYFFLGALVLPFSVVDIQRIAG